MRPFAFVVFSILLLQAPTGASPKHDRAARAAWAWIAVSKAQEVAPVPAPEPVAGKCWCDKGYQCDCDPCLCPGCPAKRGWTWSDEEGGCWWRNKPRPQAVEPVRQPAYNPAYNPVGFSRGGSRSGGC
jgi:hypothetical protein